jgi:prephenate dehydratase
MKKGLIMEKTVATLGDKKNILTCSLYIAHKKYDSQIEKIPFLSFEEAINALKKGKVDTCIVPSAYPKIANFITDLQLDIREIFLENIPNLVLVGTTKIKPKNIKRLFLHPATESIMPTFLQDSSIEKIFVSSNSEACRKLKANPNNSIAITNELASNHYQLYLYDTLRTKMKMPFIAFSRIN